MARVVMNRTPFGARMVNELDAVDLVSTDVEEPQIKVPSSSAMRHWPPGEVAKEALT